MTTANKIQLVSDRVERAKSLLLSQFRDSPNINKLVSVLVKELQELEFVLNDLQKVRTLQDSYGVWLDEIGRQLKVDRGSYNDEEYKSAIKIAMFKKTASATAEDILRIVELLTGDMEVSLTNNYPYMMELTSYLFCIGDDESGYSLLANLFPVNTAIKINKRSSKSFGFGPSKGFSSGSRLNSLVYTRYGLQNDPRFTLSKQVVIPPTLPTAPFIVTPPTVSGLNELGQTLTTTDGFWGGDEPITYTYQWLRDGAVISGETASAYTVVVTDQGTLISCLVTATNAAGSASSQSNSVLISDVAPPVSVFTSNLGLESGTGVKTIVDPNIPVSAFSAFNIKPDGTVVRTDTTQSGTNVENDQWLTTTGAGLGANYTISYTVVSGDTPTGIQPNVTYNLGTQRDIIISLTGQFAMVSSALLSITIRSISDPTISQTRTVQIGAELIDNI